MELTAINQLREIEENKKFTNEPELENVNDSLKDISEKIEDYLKNNEIDDVVKEKNNAIETKKVSKNVEKEIKDEKKPIDIDIETKKNLAGDVTILGKITIEKSVAKKLEKARNNAKKTTNKGVKFVQDGLLKIYELVKDTFIGKASLKIIDTGKVALKTCKNALQYGGKLLKNGVNQIGKAIKKIKIVG